MAASSSLDHLSNRMKLEWHSKLNTEMVPAKNFRRTSIIGTIGMWSAQSLFASIGFDRSNDSGFHGKKSFVAD